MAEKETGLNITQEEFEKIQTALENKDFRKMFAEYAKEISDPENKKKYEEEIAQLEAERGMDVKFVYPQDGFVVKTGIKNEGGKKAFINICQSDVIAEPSSEFVNRKLDDDQSVPGQQWSIPYSLSPPKDDVDKAAKKCVVYNVIFHTKTYQMGLEDPRFKKLIIDTSLEAIEEKWNVKLDQKNLKYPKLKFKGVKESTVIRSSNEKGFKEPGADIDVGDKKLPYPYNTKTSTVTKSDAKQSASHTENHAAPSTQEFPVKRDVTPKYAIVHRGLLDLQNFTNARDSRSSTRPQELVINIDLPLCESSAGVDLDIFEKQLILNSADPLYHLDISLPYPVIEHDGGAKFDKSKRRLIVTLPVVPSPPGEQMKHTDDEHVICDVVPDPSSLVNSETRGCNTANGKSSCVETGSEVNGVEAGNEDVSTRICVDHEENMVNTENEVTEPEDIVDQENTRLPEGNGEQCETLQDAECPQGSRSNQDKTANKSEAPGIACPFFNTPGYTFHQDSQSVTFILHVANVSIDSTSLGFNDNKCYINFPSPVPLSPSLASQEYALHIQFADNCLINSEKSKIDSNETNLVLVLFKQECSVGFWDWCMIGSDGKMEKKLFLTEASLKESLEQSEDPWTSGPSTLVTNHKIEKVSEEETTIQLDLYTKAPTQPSCTDMGNILTRAEELLHDEVNHIDNNLAENAAKNALNAKNILSPLANLSINDSKVPLETGNNCGDDCDVFDPRSEKVGLDVELDEVEVAEENYEDGAMIEADHHGLSTVQEVDSPEGRKNQEVAGDAAELQRARALKCKRNRRRRRRSTGSHESSSISEEEGESGAGRKRRGKHARRLRKTRSLSFGSSAESHDDVEDGSHGNGHRSVRFNLVPEVHLFSNRSDKKKWKEIRRQESLTENDQRSEVSAEGNLCKMKSSLKHGGKGKANGRVSSEESPEGSGEDVGKFVASETDAKPSGDNLEKPQLTNSLIFDLDD